MRPLNTSSSAPRHSYSPPAPPHIHSAAPAAADPTVKASSSQIPIAEIPIHRESPNNVTIIQPVDDIRLMCPTERKGLTKGPVISIRIGDAIINGIPKRAAMAVSRTLNQFFSANPTADSYTFRKHLPEVGAVRHILCEWLAESCFGEDPDQVQSGGTLYNDLSILQASRRLGMEKYTAAMLAYHVNYFKKNLPTYEEIAQIVLKSMSLRDPVYRSLVNSLAKLVVEDGIPDPEYFAEFLDRDPWFKNDIEATADRIRRAREARAAKNQHKGIFLQRLEFGSANRRT